MCSTVSPIPWPAEILIESKRITKIERSVGRPTGAWVLDLSERTVNPGFIDTHVHLTMDAANLAQQTLQSSAAEALEGQAFFWWGSGYATSSRPREPPHPSVRRKSWLYSPIETNATLGAQESIKPITPQIRSKGLIICRRAYSNDQCWCQKWCCASDELRELRRAGEELTVNASAPPRAGGTLMLREPDRWARQGAQPV
jgi:hypothetical protein